MPTPSYQTEFPDYPELDVTLPAGYTDTSGHNESCPSFERTLAGGLVVRVLIDYPDNDKREEHGTVRFTFWVYHLGRLLEPTPALHPGTDDWEEFLKWDADLGGRLEPTPALHPAQLMYKPETSWGTLTASTFNTPIRNDRGIAAPITAPMTYTMTVSGVTEAEARDISLVMEGKLKSTAPKPSGYCAANTTTTPGSPRYIWEFAGFDEPGVLRKLLNLCETLGQDESPGKLLNDLGWEIVPIYGEPQ